MEIADEDLNRRDIEQYLGAPPFFVTTFPFSHFPL
jgi:hypothetical protein